MAASDTAAGLAPKAILRYWLALVRQEEALNARLRASAATHPDQPELRQPRSDHRYIKLLPKLLVGPEPLSDTARRTMLAQHLTGDGPGLELPVSGEAASFLETCLQLERGRSTPRDTDADATTFVVGFPTFHFARENRLGTLLRAPVGAVDWRDAAGRPWKMPTDAMRRSPAPIEPPATLRIAPTGVALPGTEVLPYHFDSGLAAEMLGLVEEHIDQLLSQLEATPHLTPVMMIAAVTALITEAGETFPADAVHAALEQSERLRAHGADTAGVATVVDAFHAAVANRLVLVGGGRVRAFPFALLWDSRAVTPTRALQQDVLHLLESARGPSPGTTLGAYLGLRAPPLKPAFHLGLRAPRPLTDDQRAVADAALQGPLTVGGGPPGTGKTELILNLAAHTIIAATRELVQTRDARKTTLPMVIASTNNRAVDNALDPLITIDDSRQRLPLAVRLGSWPVLKTDTAKLLARVVVWLDQRTDSLDAAKARLAELAQQLAALHARCSEARTDSTRRAEAEARREQLQVEKSRLETLVAGIDPAIDAAQRARAETLTSLVLRLGSVARSVGALATDAKASRADSAEPLWEAWQSGFVRSLVQELEPLGITIPMPERPSARRHPAQAFADLAACLDNAVAEVANHQPALVALPDGCDDIAQVLARIDSLSETLETLATQLAEPPKVLPPELEHQLFMLAIETREAWASAHRVELRALCADLAESLPEAPGSLKAALRDDDKARVFWRLFPVAGTTLLSVGNAFDLDPPGIDLAVIDEAGQCHPAYAVPMLHRARRALVIGDVHQLEPVIGLDPSGETRVARRVFDKVSDIDRRLAPWRVHARAANSAQRVAATSVGQVLALHDHFRCQPAIIAISDALCGYGLRIHTPPASLAPRTRQLPGPIVLHDLGGQQRARAGSWWNQAEVERVAHIVNALLRDGIKPAQIAVLTPYRGQLAALQRRLRDDRVPLFEDDADDTASAPALFAREPTGAVALGTVHRFQGGERDVVILSTTIVEPSSLAFLNERVNLVNVAVSRARQHLVVVGHAPTLLRGPITRRLIEAATHRFQG